MTSRISYYGDDADPHADEDLDELRERAFKAWRKRGAGCNADTLRLASEYAQDLGFHPDGRAIRSGSRREATRDSSAVTQRNASAGRSDPASGQLLAPFSGDFLVARNTTHL